MYKNALARLAQKEKRIKQAYRDGVDTIEEYRENKGILQAEREKIERDYSSLTAKKENAKADKEITDYPKEIQNVIDIIRSDADNKVKGEAVRSIIDYAVYNKAENRLDVYLIKYE